MLLLPLWLFPLSQVLFNLLYFTYALMCGQYKPRVLVFSFAYASTIPAAARGDLLPYFQLRAMP